MSPSKEIAHYGPSRGGVRVMLSDDGESVIVRWRYRGDRRQRSWPNTPTNRTEAKEWAKGFADELAQKRNPTPETPEPLTVSELWSRYTVAVWDHLRPNTRRLYTEHWRYWLAFVGPDFIAENVTLEMLDEFRKVQMAKLSVSVVNESMRTVRRVYNWGDGRELLARNRVARYRVRTPKDQRRESPPEFKGDESVRLLAALDPNRGDQWRPYVALAICTGQGVRSHAALHLQWADINLRTRTVTWRGRWDKMGKDWEQPLSRLMVKALRAARDHARAKGYRGPWVLFVGSRKSKRETYSAQSLWAALKSAEHRAGIPHLTGRGAHGLRRLLAGDVAKLTGNAVLAMHSIGDTDLRQASRYLKRRDPAIRQAFRDRDRTASEPPETPDNQTTTTPISGAVEGS